MSGIKESRIDLRLRSDQKQEILDAASEMGISASAFVQNAALSAAREVADQVRRIRLDEDAWQVFSDAVLGEPEINPGLRELLARPSVLDEA